MKTWHRSSLTILATLLFASVSWAGPYEIVEVNQRTHEARVKENFKVSAGDGSYGRLQFGVFLNKDWVKKLSTSSPPRVEIIEKGKFAGSIPVQWRDQPNTGQYLLFELSPELALRSMLVLVEMKGGASGIEYRVDLYSYTKEGTRKRRPLLDELVKVEFPEKGYEYTLAQVAKGIKIEYKIVIDEDVPGVAPMQFGPSFVEPPGPSGLHPRESIHGPGNNYGIFDSGLAPPPREVFKTLKKGTYTHSFDWDGRNWGGPSDTGQPKGKAFPAGTYELIVIFQGRRETEIGPVPYEITRRAKLVLK